MEKELDELIAKYEEGNMTLITLKSELLWLFSVVGRSEQLFCDCELKGSSFQLVTGEICCCKCEKERAK
jgi:hypothetical protein